MMLFKTYQFFYVAILSTSSMRMILLDTKWSIPYLYEVKFNNPVVTDFLIYVLVSWII